MGRSNYDKPFYVDVGTSVVAIRCASNHDVIVEYDYVRLPPMLNITKELCDRMNKEAEIGRPLRNCDVGAAEEQKKKDFGKNALSMVCALNVLITRKMTYILCGAFFIGRRFHTKAR